MHCSIFVRMFVFREKKKNPKLGLMVKTKNKIKKEINSYLLIDVINITSKKVIL